MKKTLTILALSGLGLAAFAQGVVSINDTAGIKISAGGVQIANSAANLYYFDVLEYNGVGAPTVTSAASLTTASWLDTGVLGQNATSVPRAGTILGATAANVTVGNWGETTASAGSAVAAYYVIVGWSANEAANNGWSTISSDITGNTQWASNSGYFGYSVVSGLLTPALTGTPAGVALVAASSPAITQGFNLTAVAVPEPATMVMAGLGGLSLLALRRKK